MLLAEVERLVDQLREMTRRRTLNARRMSDANLEARRSAVLQKKLRELQEQYGELWSSDAVDYAQNYSEYPRLALHAQELEVHLKLFKAPVKAMDTDMAELEAPQIARARLQWRRVPIQRSDAVHGDGAHGQGQRLRDAGAQGRHRRPLLRHPHPRAGQRQRR